MARTLGGSARAGGTGTGRGRYSSGGYTKSDWEKGLTRAQVDAREAGRAGEAARAAPTPTTTQAGAPQFGQRGYMRSIGQYRGDPSRGYVDPETGRPTRSLSMKEEAEQRGWPSTLAAHLMGVVPGMDVSAREFVGQPGKPAGPAPSATTFGAGRLVGDIVGMGLGIPGLGELGQQGYEAMGGGQPDDTSMGLASLLSEGTPVAGGMRGRDNGGDGFLPLPQVAATPIAPAPAPTEEDRLALAAALMGKPGYTRSGQGILNAG